MERDDTTRTEDADATRLDLDDIGECFRRGGSVHRALGDAYEFRASQQVMAREVASAFNEDAVCLLEAPPGTGKTFAYLLPAARWALERDEKVIISTSTINLQSQIIDKDALRINRMLGGALRVALVKGRRNYLCPRRLLAVAESDQETMFEQDDVDRLRAWAASTRDGSRSDLTFTPSNAAWEQVSADNAGCAWEHCRASRCFFFNARARIDRAHLLVVNHDVLFSHLRYGAGMASMIGAVDDRTDDAATPCRVVLDEAHNVVDKATMCFSLQMSNSGVRRTLRRLEGARTRAARLAKSRTGEARDALSGVRQTIDNADLATCEEDAMRLFDAMARAVDFAHAKRIPGRGDGDWMALFRECEHFNARLSALSAELDHASQRLHDAQGDESVAADLNAAKRFLQEHVEAAEQFADADGGDECVKSVSVRKTRTGEAFVELSTSPLDVTRLLRERLYDRCRTVILTSATLMVDGRFDFHRRALGVDDGERVRARAVSSPFDHEKQTLLAIATDLPEPTSGADAGGYAARLAEAVFEVVRAAGGGALVLFTSHAMLRNISDALSPRLRAHGITPLVQEEESRERILEKFKSDADSVLFAADSFREGVDVVGAALRLVVITKLPFPVPTEPVFEARTQAMRNGFHDYAVPLAVTDFRQAFGRLIRAHTDRGAVVVLDSRIDTKPYGRRFLASIPRCRTVREPLATVTQIVEECVRGGGAP